MACLCPLCKRGFKEYYDNNPKSQWNFGIKVRTKGIGNYEKEIDKENNMQPSNEMNDDLQETHQEADNDPSTRTTNQVF